MGWIDNLPNYKYSLVGRGEAKTCKLLKKACQQRNVDTSSLLEKSEYEAALAMAVVDEWCPVCLEHFERTENVTVLLCGHELHRSCVKQWAVTQFEETQQTPQCPVCRGDVKLSC